jgi:hypothetical protein
MLRMIFMLPGVKVASDLVGQGLCQDQTRVHCEAREPLVITAAGVSAEQRGDTTGRCHLSVVTCSLS